MSPAVHFIPPKKQTSKPLAGGKSSPGSFAGFGNLGGVTTGTPLVCVGGILGILGKIPSQKRSSSPSKPFSLPLVESPSLEQFKSSVDVVLGDVGWWWPCSDGGMLNLKFLEAFSNLNNFTILENWVDLFTVFTLPVNLEPDGQAWRWNSSMNTLKWCSDIGRSETHFPLVFAALGFFCLFFLLLVFTFVKSLTLHCCHLLSVCLRFSWSRMGLRCHRVCRCLMGCPDQHW